MRQEPNRARLIQTQAVVAKTQTQELSEAVELYLDLMYDWEVGKFDRAFSPSAQLHGCRDGKMTCWPAAY